METLQHFSHEHLLTLFQLKSNYNGENSDSEDEDENKDKFEVNDRDVGKCKMCNEEIYSFHLCYYSCKDCDYSLHKFCALLPTTQQNHPLHAGHKLTLSQDFQLHDPDVTFMKTVNSVWLCDICKDLRKRFYNYYCSICKFNMDIICATMIEQKMNHPSHPHQLQRFVSKMTSSCHACGEDHNGTFYHCTTCLWFKIHLDCALLPAAKLLIQQSTKGSFSHDHLLSLTYSFPYVESKDKHFPLCRVCEGYFNFFNWHYRCNKCQYYVHVHCATSKSFKRTSKHNTISDDPNLIHCPFSNESYTLLMHHSVKKGEKIVKREIDGEMFNHPHPLILIETILYKSTSLHDPMKKVELLCDGCVRPIMDVPFYKCSQHCDFVLHEWCTRLPFEIQHYHHPKHTLVLLPRIPEKFLGLYWCEICYLPSNGFAYGCMQCKYYVDVTCAFIPHAITHDAHPYPLLLRHQSKVKDKRYRVCRACMHYNTNPLGFDCRSCDFHLHTKCALLLPKTIRHKYDEHPLSLRYFPAENHSGDYFCEICEDELDQTKWFYHCSTCALSMHNACAPVKLQCERSTFAYFKSIYLFLNVKFERKYKLEYHPHPITLIQGINADGQCIVCYEQLQYSVILKCFQCKFACHTRCVSKNPAISHP